jgi:hypothetical protein
LAHKGGGDVVNGEVVAFLIGAMAGVAAWMILAEAHRDMESFVRSFPSWTGDDRIELACDDRSFNDQDKTD